MLIRKLVVVGLVGFVSLAANIATAEDADAPGGAVVEGVDLVDPSRIFSDRFQLSIGEGERTRFAALAPTPLDGRSRDRSRQYEVEIIAPSLSGFDVSFAQRGGVGFNNEGDVEQSSRGSELRLGRGLRGDDGPAASAEPTWYLFAGSEDEALVWRPGSRNDFGGSGSGFALQDQVEIGDLQVGITYERYGIQASLAYVEREFSFHSGSQGFKQDENFAGLTVTMRR